MSLPPDENDTARSPSDCDLAVSFSKHSARPRTRQVKTAHTGSRANTINQHAYMLHLCAYVTVRMKSNREYQVYYLPSWLMYMYTTGKIIQTCE